MRKRYDRDQAGANGYVIPDLYVPLRDDSVEWSAHICITQIELPCGNVRNGRINIRLKDLALFRDQLELDSLGHHACIRHLRVRKRPFVSRGGPLKRLDRT